MERVLLKVAWSMGFNLRVASDAEYIDRERESPKNLSDRCHILASALQQHHDAKDKLFSDLPKSSLSTSRQETIRPFFPISHFLFPPERVAAKWATY